MVYPQYVTHIRNTNKGYDGNRHTYIYKRPTPRAILHPTPKEVDARRNAQQRHVDKGRKGEVSRSLREVGIKEVAHHIARKKHLVGINEVERRSIGKKRQSNNHLTYHATKEQKEVVDHKVYDQRKKRYGGN